MAIMLTAKREAFALHYAQHRSGPAAYVHAFSVSPKTNKSTIDANATKLLNNTEIKTRIDELLQAATAASPVTMDLAQFFGRLVQIATADPDELIGLRVGNCRHCNGENFQFQWREREYLEACDKAQAERKPAPPIAGGFGFRANGVINPDCPECCGEGMERVVPRDTSKLSPSGRALFAGVEKTKQGLKVKMQDQGKALDMIGRVLGAYKDSVDLKGLLGIVAQHKPLDTSDPHAAERAYRAMLEGKG